MELWRWKRAQVAQRTRRRHSNPACAPNNYFVHFAPSRVIYDKTRLKCHIIHLEQSKVSTERLHQHYWAVTVVVTVSVTVTWPCTGLGVTGITATESGVVAEAEGVAEAVAVSVEEGDCATTTTVVVLPSVVVDVGSGSRSEAVSTATVVKATFPVALPSSVVYPPMGPVKVGCAVTKTTVTSGVGCCSPCCPLAVAVAAGSVEAVVTSIVTLMVSKMVV